MYETFDLSHDRVRAAAPRRSGRSGGRLYSRRPAHHPGQLLRGRGRDRAADHAVQPARQPCEGLGARPRGGPVRLRVPARLERGRPWPRRGDRRRRRSSSTYARPGSPRPGPPDGAACTCGCAGPSSPVGGWARAGTRCPRCRSTGASDHARRAPSSGRTGQDSNATPTTPGTVEASTRAISRACASVGSVQPDDAVDDLDLALDVGRAEQLVDLGLDQRVALGQDAITSRRLTMPTTWSSRPPGRLLICGVDQHRRGDRRGRRRR